MFKFWSESPKRLHFIGYDLDGRLPVSSTERILAACSCGCGLREALDGLSCGDRTCTVTGPREGRYTASIGRYTVILYGADRIAELCRALGLRPVWVLEDQPDPGTGSPSGIVGG